VKTGSERIQAIASGKIAMHEAAGVNISHSFRDINAECKER
jgi:hypothetical protein